MKAQTPRSTTAVGAGVERGLPFAALPLLKTFRWALLTNWFLYLLTALLVGTSLLLSLNTDAWHWFQRSGALMVSIGAVLSTRQPLRQLLALLIGDEAMARNNSPGQLPKAEMPPELQTCICGFLLVAMGTLIWAYGDLLGCLLQWNSSCLA